MSEFIIIMKKTILLLVAVLVSSVCANLHADQTFTDQATFESTVVCDNSIASDFSLFGTIDAGDPFDLPIVQPFGGFEFGDSPLFGEDETDPNSPFLVNNDLGQAIFASVSNSIILTTDLSNGQIAGFGFEFEVVNFTFGSFTSDFTELTVNIIDTDGNVAETFVAIDIIDEPTTEINSNLSFLGWQNCNNIDVARIEFFADDAVGFLLSNGSVCFNEIIVEEDPTAQSCIEDVIDAINAIIPMASAQDQTFLNEAVYQLMNSLDPSFWATEDRLSSHGTGFFSSVFNATYFLECTSDPAAVADIQNSLQDCLSLVVDNEIDFALENPYVNNNLLVYSDFFESYADAYSDAGLFLEAVLLHFYAWLFAFWA